MDEIGNSHIATADFLICGVTLVLIVYLERLPRSSNWSRALAVLCGCLVLAIISFLLLANNLNRDAVFELAFIAFALCVSLWRWNDRRVKTNVANEVTPSNLI